MLKCCHLEDPDLNQHRSIKALHEIGTIVSILQIFKELLDLVIKNTFIVD